MVQCGGGLDPSLKKGSAITINVNLRLSLILKINNSNLHQHILKQVSLLTTASRYFCWYVGKSLLGTAAVNVAIICIFNIRRRENSLMKQILDFGKVIFPWLCLKEKVRKEISKIYSYALSYSLFQIRFFSQSKICAWKVENAF